ncbi:MAG: histidinol dehydrogenase [Clostridia bacterium]|nr:histidinol dehydrogenase [Clostridia bacterium]
MLKVYTKENATELLMKLRDRAENISPEIMNSVSAILDDVRKNGDEAVKRYTEKFDGVKPDDFYLSREEQEKYIALVPDELRKTIERSAENIAAFSAMQKRQGNSISSDGKLMGERIIPLKRVGIYVPGGTAAYPSSVLMNAIPARTAGVGEIVMVTPPKAGGINPAVIYAAKVAGVDKILTVGGAQAVAALAYGTESIPRVDKIVGPGNIFVAMAKKLVFGAVDIDMIAGPSEILIVADSTADPAFVAADLLSQAEHDKMAASILVTDSKELIDNVQIELEKQLALLPRTEIAGASVDNYGSAVLLDSVAGCIEFSNEVAPEHLELAVADPLDVLESVKNAGSVFLGEYTPEPLGDYFAGPNHVLPTNGTARFASPLSVDTFVKKSQFLCYSRDALMSVKDDVIRFAESEGLGAHANSVRIRFKDE